MVVQKDREQDREGFALTMGWQVDWKYEDGSYGDTKCAEYLPELIEIVRLAANDRVAFFINIEKFDDEKE